MIRIRRFFALVLATAMVGVASAQEAGLKFATVDMQELFRSYYRTNEAQRQINATRAEIQKLNNERMTQIRELEQTIDQLRRQIDDPSINDDRKQALFQDFQLQQQEAIAYDRERREWLQRSNLALQDRMMQSMKGILEELGKIVDEYARQEDFDMVIDKSGISSNSQVPLIIFSKESFDITSVLLDDLNKDAPPEALLPVEEAPAGE